MSDERQQSETNNHLSTLEAPPIPELRRDGYEVADEIDEDAPLIVVKSIPRLIVRPYYSMLGIKEASVDVMLREPVAQRLQRAASLLPEGFSLLLLDGWRSGDVQRAIYEHFTNVASELGEDPGKYAFDLDASLDRGFPTEDAPHRTGGAVDVTLVGPDGSEWPMGTEFDAISPRSATRALEVEFSSGLPVDSAALFGRRTLYYVMTTAGFTNYPEEWWHYDYGNAFWRFYGTLLDGNVFRTVTGV